jgi:hypothetical protein
VFKNYSDYLIKQPSWDAFAITISIIRQMHYNKNNGKKNGTWQIRQRITH